ncbi:MAG: gephyrin-like molybdotransferase Glp [bacterium]
MISLKQAQELSLKYTKETNEENVDLFSSLLRVLKKDIYADIDIPNFNRSAMDGYAVKSEDLKNANKDNPIKLDLIERLPAGYIAKQIITFGKAIKIMTGAMMPNGADAVVMIEDTEIKEDKILVFKSIKKGENIFFKGEDLKKGELVLEKGNIIRSQELSILASLNKSLVSVSKKPKIGIISTGDELVEIGKDLKQGQIRESNSFSIAGACILSGAEPLVLGISKDNKEDLLKKFNNIKELDIIILSGGVSIGDYDIVKDILIKDLGVHQIFWKVSIKPGKPIFFGCLNDMLVFGLPGYPTSSMIAFELLVRPVILKMLGKNNVFRSHFKAELKKDIKRKSGRQEFQRAILTYENGKYFVMPTFFQLSSVVISMIKANCLIIIPEEISEIKFGEMVEIMLLDEK